MLNNVFKFKDPDGSLTNTFPCIITEDNGDGTYQGKFDLDNMTAHQKLMALSSVKYDAIMKKIAC